MKHSKLILLPLMSLLLIGCNPTPSSSNDELPSNSDLSSVGELIHHTTPPVDMGAFPEYYRSESFPSAVITDFLNDFKVTLPVADNHLIGPHFYLPTIQEEGYGTYLEIFHYAPELSYFTQYVSILKNDPNLEVTRDLATNFIAFDTNGKVKIELSYFDATFDYYGASLFYFITPLDDLTNTTTTVWPTNQINNYLNDFGLTNSLPEGEDRAYVVNYYRYFDDLEFNYLALIVPEDTGGAFINHYINEFKSDAWTKTGTDLNSVYKENNSTLEISFMYFDFDGKETSIVYITPYVKRLARTLPFTYDQSSKISFATEAQLVTKDPNTSVYQDADTQMIIKKGNATVDVGNIGGGKDPYFAPVLRIYAGQEIVISANNKEIKGVVITYDRNSEKEEGIYLNALINSVKLPARAIVFDDYSVVIKAYGPLISVSLLPYAQTRLLSISVYY